MSPKVNKIKQRYTHNLQTKQQTMNTIYFRLRMKSTKIRTL